MFDVRSSAGSHIQVQFSLSATMLPAPVTSSPADDRGPVSFPFQSTEPAMGEPAPALRLYDPAPPISPLPNQRTLFDDSREPPQQAATSPPAAAPLPTLREAWKRWWLMEHEEERAASTVGEDRTALDRFESACAAIFEDQKVPDSQKKYRIMYPVLQTANPPVDQITRELLVAVKAVWKQDESPSANTYRKRFSTIKKVLLEGVERDKLPKAPKMPKVGVSKLRGFAGAVRAAEVEAFDRACEVATWPRLRGSVRHSHWWLTPAVFWRTWTRGWWLYGLRTQDLAACKGSFDGLLWSAVRDSPYCPAEGSEDVTCADGWFYIQPQKTERTKGQPIIAPRDGDFNRWLELFRGLDSERVFPNGRSHKKFYEMFHEIRTKAGLPDDFTISGIKPNRSFRKACSQAWNRVAPGLKLGEWLCGHADLGTNASHYESVAEPFVEHLAAIERPASFADESLLPKTQRSLLA